MTKIKKAKKPAIKSSVLRRQKLKKNPKKRREIVLRRFFFGIVILSVIAAASAFFYSGQKMTTLVSGWLAKPTDWHVSLRLDGDRPLEEKMAAKIIAAAQKSLGAGTPADLEKTARLVQKQAAFSTVHFLKTTPNHIVLTLKQRHPLLCVEADKLRFVGTDDPEAKTGGAFSSDLPRNIYVYGQAEDPAFCKGPLLSGVFPTNRKYELNDDYSLALRPEEREALQEAIVLLKDTNQFNLTVKSFEFRNFRGFFVLLKDNETEIALGRAPFKAKLEKLVELMDRLSKKGDVASRIELDYQGKAFIKLKKM
jgi:hypothetical protein